MRPTILSLLVLPLLLVACGSQAVEDQSLVPTFPVVMPTIAEGPEFTGVNTDLPLATTNFGTFPGVLIQAQAEGNARTEQFDIPVSGPVQVSWTRPESGDLSISLVREDISRDGVGLVVLTSGPRAANGVVGSYLQEGQYVIQVEDVTSDWTVQLSMTDQTFSNVASGGSEILRIEGAVPGSSEAFVAPEDGSYLIQWTLQEEGKFVAALRIPGQTEAETISLPIADSSHVGLGQIEIYLLAGTQYYIDVQAAEIPWELWVIKF